MDKIKSLFYYVFNRIYRHLKWRWNSLIINSMPLGHKGYAAIIYPPSLIYNPKLVYLSDYSSISANHMIINSKGKFVIGKYCIAAAGLVVVPDLHISTVGIPISILAPSHIHDQVLDVIVDDDVWIGANVVLLGGCHIGRGCIIGANSLLNKKTIAPPYAVLAGNPARIIAVKFSIEQILEHERKLYAPNERLTQTQLEELFTTYFEGKRIFGIDGNLTADEQTQLEKTMKKYHFKYPTFEENNHC